MTIGGDIEQFMVVEELEDIGGRRRVDNGSGDDLVHRFVVGRFGRIMDQASAAAVNGTRQEGHTDRFLKSNSLESADQVGTFEILSSDESIVACNRTETWERERLTLES